MVRLLQSTVQGLGLGTVYVLLGLGFVIIFKSMGVISFAQPGMMVLGAWWVIYFGRILGLGFPLAVLIAVLLTALIGMALERAAIRPMIGEPVFAIAILTIGLDIVLRVIVNDLLGPQVRSMGDPWGLKTFPIAGVVIQQRYVARLVIGTVVVGLLLAFFKYTRIGLAMRATAFDQEVAMAQGVSVGAVFALSWAIAGGLAALAGTFVGLGSGIDQQSAFVALKALPAIILGGLDSIHGAVIGGLLVGLIEGYSLTYQSQYAGFLGDNFSQVVPYLVMLAVLLVRPFGLFGTREVERV
ncbi:MAG TPA: branched-chain amino acid ABC transporter permease [Actinomycetota bacterium]|jgi:branched-chain amino acid transport system permease protein|nr:branched-chain amino acid ABC transporter permease [Actinomycetota bacterium]